MDTLPTEILLSVINHLPRSSLSKIRLISRRFNNLTFPIYFSHIPSWLDYKGSHLGVIVLGDDVCDEPAVIWSPWAQKPDLEVDDVWLGIVWKITCGSEPPSVKVSRSGSEDWEGNEGEVLSAANFATLSGRSDMNESRILMGQNRFLLHRAYREKSLVEKQAFESWWQVVRLCSNL